MTAEYWFKSLIPHSFCHFSTFVPRAPLYFRNMTELLYTDSLIRPLLWFTEHQTEDRVWLWSARKHFPLGLSISLLLDWGNFPAPLISSYTPSGLEPCVTMEVSPVLFSIRPPRNKTNEKAGRVKETTDVPTSTFSSQVDESLRDLALTAGMSECFNSNLY